MNGFGSLPRCSGLGKADIRFARLMRLILSLASSALAIDNVRCRELPSVDLLNGLNLLTRSHPHTGAGARPHAAHGLQLLERLRL